MLGLMETDKSGCTDVGVNHIYQQPVDWTVHKLLHKPSLVASTTGGSYGREAAVGNERRSLFRVRSFCVYKAGADRRNANTRAEWKSQLQFHSKERLLHRAGWLSTAALSPFFILGARLPADLPLTLSSVHFTSAANAAFVMEASSVNGCT